MAKDPARLRKIYEKTDGMCHICHGKLCFSNHGINGKRGAWHIEHSIAKARGGTDHLNNLFAACIDCNIAKSVSTSRTARSYHGKTRAPYCREKKESIRENNTGKGIVLGALFGLVGGPVGFFVGATIGGIIGSESSPSI